MASSSPSVHREIKISTNHDWEIGIKIISVFKIRELVVQKPDKVDYLTQQIKGELLMINFGEAQIY